MTACEIIAQQILDKLEAGVIPWKPTWKFRVPMNYISRKPYSGINMLLLSLCEYPRPYFLTYRQIQNMGGYIKAGEKGHLVSFICNLISEDTEQTDTEKIKKCRRYYRVWNITQTSLSIPEPVISTNTDQSAALINSMPDPPSIVHKNYQPCYNRRKDTIHLPLPQHFDSPEAYYATLFHELIHATGHQRRLNRKTLNSALNFADDKYGQEELIAEIGSFMLCSKAEIATLTVDNSVSYIQSWLKILKDDKTLLFSASKFAQEAFNYITGAIVSQEELVA